MTTERLQNYARRHGFEEGIATGIAQQKAKDEKRLAQKDAEIAKQAKKITELENLLKERLF